MAYASINARMNCRGMLRRVRVGFTFVEIVLVLVILAIVTAIAVPKFANAAQAARENTLKADLHYLRTQISVYKAQHKVPPGLLGFGPPSGSLFIKQKTQYTDEAGRVNSTAGKAFRFGPYLKQMPANPITRDASIRVINTVGSLWPDNSSGWLYNAATLEVIVNSTLSDDNGIRYSQY
jgi:type II secretory pathway pseudopilin PulG